MNPLLATADAPYGRADLTVPVRTRSRFLPTRWPFVALFAGFPIWWALGLGSFIWVILAVPMVAAVVVKPHIVVPRGFIVFVLFYGWMLASVVGIDSGDRLIGFLLRAAYYLAAAIVMLFVMNPPSDLPAARVVRIMTIFWMIVVAGGYLGLLVPTLSFTGPAARLLPDALLSNDWIRSLVSPSVADIHSFLGFAVPRPKAPFPFTNGWGAAFALLFPFSLAATTDPAVGLSTRLIRVTQVLSVVPVVISLNRGLWLSLGIGMIYASIRFLATGQAKALIGVLAAIVSVVALVTLTPLGELVSSRVDNGHSDEGRQELYVEAIDRTLESPFLGYGAPRPSEVNPNGPSVGTHGQLWLVLFSHGFVGAGLWVGFYATMIWNTRAPSSMLGFYAHVTLIIGAVQMLFYGQLPHQIVVIAVAVGLAALETRRPRRTQARPAGGPSIPLALERPAAPEPSPSSAMVHVSGGSMPPVPMDMAARLRGGVQGWPISDPSRQLGPGGPKPSSDDTESMMSLASSPGSELEWLGGMLFADSTNVRMAKVADLRPGEEIRERLLVSPGIDRPQFMVSTARRAAANSVRRYTDASGPVERLTIGAVSAGLRVGMAKRLRSRQIVIAGPEGLGRLSGKDSLMEHIGELVGVDTDSMAVTIGPPRANRKPVLQLMAPDGEIVAFAKIGWSPLTRELVRNEAAWLGYLGRSEMAGILVPRHIGVTEWRGLDVAVLGPVPIRAYPMRRPGRPPSLAVFRQIATSTGTTDELLGESHFAERHIEQAAGTADAELVTRTLARHEEELLEFGTWHGDFSPWNMSSGLRGISIIDWEFARPGVPVGFDVLHFGLQVNQNRRGLSADRALVQALESGRPTLERLGAFGSVAEATEACYLIELASRARLLLSNGAGDHLAQLQHAVRDRLDSQL